MTVQITVIGLGQLGASIGLALNGRENIRRVGHDREPAVMKKAKSLNAFDETVFNLPASVEKSDLVVLCLPLDQVEDTLKYIATDLREDAVVMDMSPLKSVVAAWFAKHVPAGRHYIGLVPTINPLMLMDTSHGIEAARADLFDKATIGIAAPPNARPEAVKLAEDLVRLLKKLVRHTPQIEMLLDQLDSLTDLLEVMGPITREGVDKLTGVLSDLERKGYFRLFQDGAQLADRVAVSLAREEAAPPLETSLFGLLRQMQDPAVRRGLALTLHLLKVVGEQAAVEGKTQKGK